MDALHSNVFALLKQQYQQLPHGRLRGDREKPYKQVIS
jgi:hypothetical protein